MNAAELKTKTPEQLRESLVALKQVIDSADALITVGSPYAEEPAELRARQARQLADLALGQQRRTTDRCSSHAP